jgi:hypothetical protein
MEWLGVIIGFALGCLASSYWWKDRAGQAEQTERKRMQAEGRYLDELRRELALWLLRQNPPAFKDAFQAARDYDAEMRKANKHRVAADRASLAAKYPFFSDLDLVGMKHFVPIRAGSMNEFDVVQRYLDISKFLTLLSIERHYSDLRPFSERDEGLIEDIIREAQDADLRREIEIAMGRYYAFRQNRALGDEAKFTDKDYEVTSINELYRPDIRYGILVKADGRRGIYSFFVADSDKTYYSYEEADESFKPIRSLSTR